MTKEEVNGYSYRIMQASPTELIVILYEMAERYLTQAVNECRQDQIEEFRVSLKYAQRVVNELIHALDMKYEISMNLMQIYLFINRALLRASVSKDTQEIERCIKMIEKLRKSFSIIKSEDKRGPVMENTQQVYAGLTYSKNNLNESFGLESNRGFRV